MSSPSISSIMTKNVVCVSPEQKIIDVKHIYEKKKFHHHIPVTENGKLVGMLSLIDDEAVYNELCVKDIMSPNPYVISPDTSIISVAEELTKGRYHAVLILRNEDVVGIVSTADIIRYYINNLKKA